MELTRRAWLRGLGPRLEGLFKNPTHLDVAPLLKAWTHVKDQLLELARSPVHLELLE